MTTSARRAYLLAAAAGSALGGVWVLLFALFRPYRVSRRR